MITYIDLPEGTGVRQLPFYLAMEEYAAKYLDRSSDYFFMWRVRPTVIIGRNQLMDTEVNREYCSANGIEIWRRKSGGGCVYADPNNIMFSYVTDARGSVAETFGSYTERVAAFLRSLGLEAEAGSRNDVSIDGRKVSGNAFYQLPGGRCIAHGTMLFDVDMERMSGAITPSQAKLASKGVASVRSRVTSVQSYLPDMTIEAFMDRAQAYMSDARIQLSEADVREIERLEEIYHTDEWLRGRNPAGDMAIERRIDGVGDFRISMTIEGGRIKRVNMAGDFFMTADLDSGLLDRLRGAEYSREGIYAALDDVDPERVVMGLTREMIADMLMG